MAEDRWEGDYLHSTAAQYQQAHEAAYVQARQDGVPAPDGWRRPHEPVCKRCQYVIVDGSCLGCAERAARTSLSERGAAAPAAATGLSGTSPVASRSDSDVRDAA